MNLEKIERVCRAVVSVAALVCITIAAVKFENANLLWWYMPVFFMYI